MVTLPMARNPVQFQFESTLSRVALYETGAHLSMVIHIRICKAFQYSVGKGDIIGLLNIPWLLNEQVAFGNQC